MKELAPLLGKRIMFLGTVEKIVIKNGYGGPEKKIHLSDLMDIDGTILAEKTIINYTKGFEDLGIVEKGTRICFEARVKQKVAGGWSKAADTPLLWEFALSYPTNLSIVNT